MTFHALDVVRWQLLDVNLAPADRINDLVSKVSERLEGCHETAEGRFSAIRLLLHGACRAHRSLVGKTERQELLAELRNQANSLGDEVWLEKIVIDTSPEVDWNQLRAASDLLGDLLRDVQELQADGDALLELGRDLAPLLEKAGAEMAEADIKMEDQGQLRTWLLQAQGLLVGRLWEGGG